MGRNCSADSFALRVNDPSTATISYNIIYVSYNQMNFVMELKEILSIFAVQIEHSLIST